MCSRDPQGSAVLSLRIASSITALENFNDEKTKGGPSRFHLTDVEVKVGPIAPATSGQYGPHAGRTYFHRVSDRRDGTVHAYLVCRVRTNRERKLNSLIK